MKLGVNIDHIATLRNARGFNSPSILRALKECEKNHVDTITVHLREDRRHIRDSDLRELKKHSKTPINLEMALTKEMIEIVKQIKPNFICLVPEKRNEITTEGGLNINLINKTNLSMLLRICSKFNIQISAFVNPDKKIILLAKKLGFHAVEIHTGALDKLKINKKKLNNINNMIKFAHSIELVVNIGHGLNFNNIKLIKNKKIIDTVHIGHFIISEAIFLSLSKTIKKFQHLIKS
jgi:pyridoxine 5-phosphate synthase